MNEPITTTPRNTNVLGKPPVSQRIRPRLTRQQSNSFSEENNETPLVKNTNTTSSCSTLATPVSTSSDKDYKVILAGMFNSKVINFLFIRSN